MSLRILVIFVLSALLPSLSLCYCENQCSGNGKCETSGICNCDLHFNTKVAPDCSLRSCPLGKAWAAVVEAYISPHHLVECSNRGVCNRNTGQCVCESGFEGLACERMKCPNDCNNHGQCVSLQERAKVLEVNYEEWDSDMIYGCICNDDYFGYDCSQKKCLSGLEATIDAKNEIYQLQCTCSLCEGYFVLSVLGNKVKLFADTSVGSLSNKLKQFSNIVDIRISSNSSDSNMCGDITVQTTFEFSHSPGKLNTPLKLYETQLAAKIVIFQSQQQFGEAFMCSRKGICDTILGTCDCISSTASLGGAFDRSDGDNISPGPGRLDNCNFPTVPPIACPFGVNDLGSLSACSDHGMCNLTTFSCDCAEGYSGVSCSHLKCPNGTSWFDEDFPFHSQKECSNRGLCNVVTGKCSCQTGFIGDGCEKLDCVADCSGKGSCITIGQLALLAESSTGSLLGYIYRGWDRNSVMGCYCDRDFYLGPFAKSRGSYTGYKCAELSCPFGHNPLVVGKQNEVQLFQCKKQVGSSGADGYFAISFAAKTSAWLSSNSTLKDLQDALDTLTAVKYILKATFKNSSGASSKVCEDNSEIIISFNLPGDPDLLRVDERNLVGANITVTEYLKGTTVGEECSGQGVCDRSSGVCTCFKGMTSGDGSNDGLTFGEAGDCNSVVEFPT